MARHHGRRAPDSRSAKTCSTVHLCIMYDDAKKAQLASREHFIRLFCDTFALMPADLEDVRTLLAAWEGLCKVALWA